MRILEGISADSSFLFIPAENPAFQSGDECGMNNPAAV
jgi:hypothetical protein